MQAWTEWVELTDENLEKVPKEKGVYQLRTNKKFERLKGETDILYIGCGDLYDRLTCFEELDNTEKDKSWKHDVRKRLREYLKYMKKKGKNVKIEFRYHITGEYEDKENKLLDEFENEHLEYPPFNKKK